jgi:hypothetical protein
MNLPVHRKVIAHHFSARSERFSYCDSPALFPAGRDEGGRPLQRPPLSLFVNETFDTNQID